MFFHIKKSIEVSFYMTESERVNSFPLFSCHWGACFHSSEEVI